MKRFLVPAFVFGSLLMTFSWVEAQEAVSRVRSVDETRSEERIQRDKGDGLLLEAIEEALKTDESNPILEAQKKMLAYRIDKYDDSIRPPQSANNNRWTNVNNRRVTNLRFEQIQNVGPSEQRTEISRELDILTGQRAIDESLQLGSIGSDRDLVDREPTVDISTIDPVAIPSHPWEEMIEGKSFEVPLSSHLAPKDSFYVSFNDPTQVKEIEDFVFQSETFVKDLYGFGELMHLKPKMLERLGLPDDPRLLSSLEELAFVSDDIDFRHRADYALILKFKPGADQLFSFFFGDTTIHDSIGDYVVITTHDSFLKKIQKTFKTPALSLAHELDFHYALSALDPRRDGVVYYSDAFIRKLTGPAYRIKARRRNNTLNRLETLQYIVFAYRGLENTWPTSFDQLVEEDYLEPKAAETLEDYALDDEGRVSHEDWGSLWDQTPVTRLEIDRVGVSEADLYKRFNTRYQSFFREFFDPIGIAFVVSDHVYLHTIILPLIERSEYRTLQNFFSQTRDLSFLSDHHRKGALMIGAGFSLDDVLQQSGFWGRNLSFPNETPSEEDLKEISIFMSEAELLDDLNDEHPLAVYQRELRKQIRAGKTPSSREILREFRRRGRVLDFVGDEIFFGIGRDNIFSQNNIANLDLWLGVDLKSRAKAEQFMRDVYAKLYEEMSSSRRGGFGFFQLSSNEPLANEYLGHTFYIIPTGFINLYYTFFEDTLYFSVSQLSINRLIEARQSAVEEVLQDTLQRPVAFTGTKHNIMAMMDLSAISRYGVTPDLIPARSTYQVRKQYREQVYRLQEALTLAQSLPDYDGTLSNTASYYRNLPMDLLEASFEVREGKLFFVLNGEDFEVEQHAFPDMYSYGRNSHPESKPQIPLDRLANSVDALEEVQAWMKLYESATVGVSFTEEGLEVKMAIKNNAHKGEPDARFAAAGLDGTPTGAPALKMKMNVPKEVYWVIIGLILGVLGAKMVSMHGKLSVREEAAPVAPTPPVAPSPKAPDSPFEGE